MNKKEKQKALYELYKSIDDLYDCVQKSEECAKNIDNEDLQKLRNESVSIRYNYLYLTSTIINNVCSIPVAHEIVEKMERLDKEKFIEKYLETFLARVEVEAFGKSRFKNFRYGVQDMQKKFSKWYELFYENDDNIEGFNEAVNEFDERMKEKSFIEIVKEFNKERMDLISSDREAAAFMFALKETEVC